MPQVGKTVAEKRKQRREQAQTLRSRGGQSNEETLRRQRRQGLAANEGESEADFQRRQAEMRTRGRQVRAERRTTPGATEQNDNGGSLDPAGINGPGAGIPTQIAPTIPGDVSAIDANTLPGQFNAGMPPLGGLEEILARISGLGGVGAPPNAGINSMAKPIMSAMPGALAGAGAVPPPGPPQFGATGGAGMAKGGFNPVIDQGIARAGLTDQFPGRMGAILNQLRGQRMGRTF